MLHSTICQPPLHRLEHISRLRHTHFSTATIITPKYIHSNRPQLTSESYIPCSSTKSNAEAPREAGTNVPRSINGAGAELPSPNRHGGRRAIALPGRPPARGRRRRAHSCFGTIHGYRVWLRRGAHSTIISIFSVYASITRLPVLIDSTPRSLYLARLYTFTSYPQVCSPPHRMLFSRSWKLSEAAFEVCCQ